MNSKQNIVVICGPTASGKTSLALQLAKELPKTNVLSADSRQIYNALDIITGKDIPEDLPKQIKFFGHGLFKPDMTANLADFVRFSHKVILESKETNTPLIIVGGTGLYLKAITYNLSNVPVPPNNTLREELGKLSLSDLQTVLQKENAERYAMLNRSDIMNPRRLIRAIEISKSNVKTPSTGFPIEDITFHWVGLQQDKETIKEDIHQRVFERIKSGAIDEVKDLLHKYPDRKLPIYTSLGVSQIIDHLENNLSIEELINNWTNAEVDYARRQMVWFKKQSDVFWYDKSTDMSLLVSELKKIYQ